MTRKLDASKIYLVAGITLLSAWALTKGIDYFSLERKGDNLLEDSVKIDMINRQRVRNIPPQSGGMFVAPDNCHDFNVFPYGNSSPSPEFYLVCKNKEYGRQTKTIYKPYDINDPQQGWLELSAISKDVDK